MANSDPTAGSTVVDSGRSTGSSPYNSSICASLRGFSGRFMASGKRMMARVGLVLGAALVSFGYVKCTFLGDPNATPGNGSTSDFSTTLTLQDSNGAPTTSFAMGQAIQFDLGVLNQAAQSDTLSFTDAQIYDFYVLDANSSTVRWRWSADKTFAQTSTSLDFAAN